MKVESLWQPQLVIFVIKQFRLSIKSIHGPEHWKRVRLNGLELSQKTGANTHVVELFALLHDSCRHNDHRDLDHGLRAAAFAGLCFDRGLIQCSYDELNTLELACRGHTHKRTSSDITIATCWDSDRLDLPRINIMPAPHRLCTEAARNPEMIERARARSLSFQASPR